MFTVGHAKAAVDLANGDQMMIADSLEDARYYAERWNRLIAAHFAGTVDGKEATDA
jgi:hypothetical protein